MPSEAVLRHCYIDEAGDTKALPSATDPNIVPACIIVGLVLEQSCLRRLTSDFLVLKGRYFPGLIPTGHFLERVKPEIKGADIRRALRGGSGRRHRRHALGFLDAFVGLLERYEIKIMGRVWIKEIAGPCHGGPLYTSSIQAIAAYFQHLLNATNDHGVMIADSRTPALNAQVAHAVFTQKFKSAGDEFDRVLEMPTFGHSQNHVGIQIADLVASALLFPMASYAYCLGHVHNVHVDAGFADVATRYGQRVRLLQYRYFDRGRRRGGIVVNDRIAQKAGSHLFTSPGS